MNRWNELKVFQWMIDSQKANPNAINVVFGGNYDFNMILRGNQPPTAEHMLKLHEKEEMHAGSFRVKIMWGRMIGSQATRAGIRNLRRNAILPIHIRKALRFLPR